MSTVDYYLRATATYKDVEDIEKTAQVVSVNKVREAPDTEDATPIFPVDPASNARSVDENSPAGTAVGKPVKANDTPDDVLTYTLDDRCWRESWRFRDRPCHRPDHRGSQDHS